MKVTTLVLLAFANGGLAQLELRETDSNEFGYKVIPITYSYNANEKILAPLLFGTFNTTPIPVVMDLGSSDFWVWETGAIIN